MPLHIAEREVEGIILLSLDGRLVLGSESAALQDAFTSLLDRRMTRAIVDLKEVPFIDSTGLGVLVSAYSSFKNAGGAVKLLNLSQRHVELLVLTKLATVFEVFDDEQNAVDSFFPDRAPHRFDILQFVKSQEADS